MSDIKNDAYNSTIDCLLAMYSLLFKAGDCTESKEDFKKIRTGRKRVNNELDRIEMAELNSNVLPDEVEKAIQELNGLTGELEKETQRIKNITETLKQVDQYIQLANRVLGAAAGLFV